MRGSDTEGRGGAAAKPLPDTVTIFEPKEETAVQQPTSENTRAADINPGFGAGPDSALDAVPEGQELLQEQPVEPEPEEIGGY